MRVGCVCSGYCLEGTHGRRAPAPRGLAHNRPELEPLCGAVVGCVEVCPLVPSTSLSCRACYCDSLWRSIYTLCRSDSYIKGCGPARDEYVCWPPAVRVGLARARLEESKLPQFRIRSCPSSELRRCGASVCGRPNLLTWQRASPYGRGHSRTLGPRSLLGRCQRISVTNSVGSQAKFSSLEGIASRKNI